MCSIKPLCKFIFSYLEENKLIFRWKIIQYIIPTKKFIISIENLLHVLFENVLGKNI